MAFIDQMTITEFKGRVPEEARRLNSYGLSQTLDVERDLFKPMLQNTSFPHESKITSSSCAPTADIEVTQSQNATNESPKSTLQSRLEKPKPPRVGAAAADVAEGEIEAEGVKVETVET
jgi:hypothetical protein